MYKKGDFYKSTVYIIDYKPDKLNSISSLVSSLGYNYYLFQTIDEFLQAYTDNMFGCILINIHNDSINIVLTTKHLLAHSCLLPVIGILNEVDIQGIINGVKKGIKNGVADFLIQPINKKYLDQAINKCFIFAQENNKHLIEYRNTINKFNSLTDREKQIFNLIIEGLPNKTIASNLLISIRTVEMHRYHIMKKMQASSLFILIKQSIFLSKFNFK
jgi:FixJ family two-component response regulator